MSNKSLATALMIVIVSIGVFIIFGMANLQLGPQPEPQPKPQPEPTPITDDKAIPASINEVVNANNQFAVEVYSELSKETGNIFFSPYSISTALAMVYEGARGKTAEEMQKVFHFPTDSANRRTSFLAVNNQLNEASSKYKLSVANALWAQVDYKFLDEYINVIKKYYSGEASNVDFKNATEVSRNKINNWVESKTNDKIKNLFPKGSLNELTRLVLTNAVYFKGTWIKQFDKEQTRNEDFKISSKQTVKTPMMRRTGEDAEFNYAETKDAQIIEMPYEGDKLSMLVLLPKNNDLTALESSLSPEKLKEWKGSLREQRVDVFMPKFTFDSKHFMSETLAKMGMPAAFSDGADFSGMDGTKNLSIQTVIHQAFIDVNEEGTEAAAATGVGMGITSMPAQQPPVFRADHPFLFAIQDKQNGNILFLGRFSNPVKQ